MSEQKEHRPRDGWCPCIECERRRKAQAIERRLRSDASAEKIFGPNWKNILAGMGDQ